MPATDSANTAMRRAANPAAMLPRLNGEPSPQGVERGCPFLLPRGLIMKRIVPLMAVLVWCSAAGPARAELWVGDSVEWMTDDSELILRAKVVKSVEVPFPGAGGFHDLTLHISEVLKGKFQGMELIIR